MELFTQTIDTVRSFVGAHAGLKTWKEDLDHSWPDGNRDIVLKEDMGLELGSPEKDSISCLLWTGDIASIVDGNITLVGPDFPESAGRSLPFGKVVLLGVEGFDEDNAYDRHKELDYLRYDLNLKGFMMRAVSQYMREWCRVSRAALSQGFSAKVLGSSIMKLFRTRPYVKTVEVLYFTSSTEDVTRLGQITTPAEKIISAMNKMAAEFDYDCVSCDYQEVCDEAEGLKGMREKLKNKTKEVQHD